MDITVQPVTLEACLLGPCFLERNEELRMSEDRAQTDQPRHGGHGCLCGLQRTVQSQDPLELLAPCSLPWGLSPSRGSCSSQAGVTVEGESLPLGHGEPPKGEENTAPPHHSPSTADASQVYSGPSLHLLQAREG